MLCPKCGNKLKVLESRTTLDGETVYRRRGCRSCNYRTYTAEFEVENNRQLQNGWNNTFRAERRKGCKGITK